MKNNCLIVFIYVVLFIQSCKTTESVETRYFPVKNVPEHIFNITVDTLREKIVESFEFKNQTGNKILEDIFYFVHEGQKHLIFFSTETSKKPLFSIHYFSKPNTENDIYIHDFGNTWVSKLYFNNGKPMECRTAFIIKLSKVNDSKTKVKIVAENPKVINGIVGYGPHGAIARETEVESSTIEEYALLLFIADKLGDKTLHPLKLPNMSITP
jgi:hypothetical protein